MAPKYRNMSAFDPYESRYDLSLIGNKLAELEEDKSKRIGAATNIAGDLYGMWGEEQTFQTNKMLNMKDSLDNPIYEKSTNTFQDLFTPSGGRVKLTDAGKTATTPSILENQSYMPSKGAINKGGALLKPEMQDVRGATNIADQTKEGVKSVAGTKAFDLLGKGMSVAGIASGIANKDPYSTIGGAVGLFNPMLGLGISALGMVGNKNKRKGSWF